MSTKNSVPDWLLSLFDDLNETYFDGKLERPFIGIQPGSMPTKNAWYAYVPYLESRNGPFAAISITEEVLAKGRDYTSDTLLHEMIHHAVATLYKEDHASHSKRFCEIANNIGARIGCLRIVPGSVAAERWPQSVRLPSR
ncbi:SprT-like domain-containing protein [Sorangium sp. So ce119]|uniref:SprT-like domain-containing protein n=1 Tax=Sorangium sp. So ce119 TaxID=3133279 RepID=UPI003F5FADB5